MNAPSQPMLSRAELDRATAEMQQRVNLAHIRVQHMTESQWAFESDAFFRGEGYRPSYIDMIYHIAANRIK